MIKVESIEPLFKDLRNTLISKQCKTEIKSEIIVIFMSLCNLNNIDSYELENLLHDILEGLKNVEEIEIDTRENLCKVPKIKTNLQMSTGGYVTLSRKKLVVVKEYLYDIHLVHELVHLTQETDAYHLPNKYDYVAIVKKALQEGEASYYQAMYTKENIPSLVEGNKYHKK